MLLNIQAQLSIVINNEARVWKKEDKLDGESRWSWIQRGTIGARFLILGQASKLSVREYRLRPPAKQTLLFRSFNQLHSLYRFLAVTWIPARIGESIAIIALTVGW
jgi:hypothetical protein